MNLNIKKWKTFFLKDIFTIKYGVNLELNACDEVLEKNDITVNFVSRTGENNGVSSRVMLIENVEPQKEGLISIAGGGSVLSTFLQDEPFYSGRDLYTLECRESISDQAKLFLITIIEQNKYKYSYGRQANKTMPFIEILLPIKNNLDGTPLIDESRKYSEEGYIPDWDFMDSYVKTLHHKPLTTKQPNSKNKDLEIEKWKEFNVSSILKIYNGKGITKEEIEENVGDFTVVQSGEENNGVLGKIDKDYCISMNYTISEKPCLTVARSGSAGFVSFQINGCVVGDSAKILLLENSVASTEVYLFIQTILTANRFKYAYGRKVTEDKYMNDIIKLPIKHNSDGTPFIDQSCKYSGEGYVPDWDFMENYIKSLPYGDRLNDVV